MAERDLNEELRGVERELDLVRASVASLRGQVGARSDGATDPEEVAAAISSADEQEALLVALETRRDGLRSRLQSS